MEAGNDGRAQTFPRLLKPSLAFSRLLSGDLSLFFGGLEGLLGPPKMVDGSLMAAMEREVEQARSRRPFTPSTRLVAIARCRGWFLFYFEHTGRRRGARALRQGTISVGEGAPQGEEGLQGLRSTIIAIARSS